MTPPATTTQRFLFAAATAAFAIVFMSCSGCVMQSYRYGRFKNKTDPSDEPPRNVVTYDDKHPILDGMELVIHGPIETISGLMGMRDSDSRPREVRMEESLAATMSYIAKNELHDVHVDVRRYQPRVQWMRLRQNRQVRPLWKYTMGTVYWTIETVLPGRAFRYTYYNPFTNTLAVNSIWREWNIYEAARAKDFLGYHDPGAYATMQHIPFVPVFQEVRVANDAITYARVQGDRDLELELYPFAYGEVFGSTMEEASFLVPGLSGLPYFMSPVIWGGSFAVGFGIGQGKKAHLESQIRGSANAEEGSSSPHQSDFPVGATSELR